MYNKTLLLLILLMSFSSGVFGQAMEFPIGASHDGFTFSNWGWDNGVIFAADVSESFTISKEEDTWDLTSFETIKLGADGTFTATSDLDSTYVFTPNEGETTQTHTLNWKGIKTLTISRTDLGEIGNNAFDFDNLAHFAIDVSQAKAVNCNGGRDGQAQILLSGGTAPYYVNGISYLSNPFTITDLSAGPQSFKITDSNNNSMSGEVTIMQPANPIILSDNSTNVDCKGSPTGILDVVVKGGTRGEAYSYNWENAAGANISIGTAQSLIGQAAGTYGVTVTDANNCTLSTNITITEPSTKIQVSLDQIIPACDGNSLGEIAISTTGGTGNYSYRWVDALSNEIFGIQEDLSEISTGTYAVTATDANNCTATLSASLTEPVAVISPDVTLCLGNNTTLSASGGSTYEWFPTTGLSASNVANPIAAPTEPTFYSVVVTAENGCEDYEDVFIMVDSEDVNENGIGDECDCEGFTSEFVVEGIFDNQIPTGEYKAGAELSSTGVVNDGSTVSFVAGERILLNSGFHAKAGSVFSANIEPCVIVTPFLEENRPLNKPLMTGSTAIQEEKVISFKVSPNPFIYQTTLQFKLPIEEVVSVHLFDQSGRMLAELLSPQKRPAGAYELLLSDEKLYGGLYYIILQTAKERIIKKVIAIKDDGFGEK